jgi:DNA polymerase-3 subunit epsilon
MMSSHHHDTLLSDIIYAVTDTETTNSSDGLRVVEIASVKVLPGFRIDFPNAFQTLVNPRCSIDYFSRSVHGITDEMAVEAPSERDAVVRFAEFMRGSIFVAHNVPFDHTVISDALRRNGIPSPITHLLDTVKLSKLLYPYLINHTLDTMISFFSLSSPRSGRHRALYDADVTALLLVKILIELSERGIKTLGDIYAFLSGQL